MDSGLKITALHAPSDKKLLNDEWIEIHNEGSSPFNTEGCAITTAVGSGRQRDVSVIKAGLIIQPNERIRIVSGSSGKKSHGDPPVEAEGVRNFHLFLKAPYLERSGITIRLVNKQHKEVCQATFDTK